MPPPPRFRSVVVDELFRQLQYAPSEARERQMNAAEALLYELDPELNYPADFVVFRITAYRSEAAGESTMLVGEALLGDLGILVERLSAELDLPADYEGRSALAIEEVAARLDVSTKTVQRYRRRGLVCHHLCGPGGRRRLACFEDALERFTARHPSRVDRAATFTRVEPERVERIVAEARRLRARERVSLNEAARRLSARHGRAHETIRAMLRRHDRAAEQPIFTERGPLVAREIALVERAERRGVPVAKLAERLGRTSGTIRRAVRRARADRLRAMDIGWVQFPTFERDDAEAVILGAPPLLSGLDRLPPLGPPAATLDWIESLGRAAASPAEDEIAVLTAGLNLLKRRVRRTLDALPTWPGATDLDAIETDLRFVSVLLRRLVALGLPSALGRIEQNLHGPLSAAPSPSVALHLERAARVVARCVELLDPSRGQRLSRLVAHAMDRALAAPDPPDAHDRTDVHAETPLAAPDVSRLLDDLAPWDRLLVLPRSTAAAAAALEPSLADAIRLRHGLDGTPPRTIASLARALRRGDVAAAHAVHRAEKILRA